MNTGLQFLFILPVCLTINAYADQRQPHILILNIGSHGTAIPQVRGLYDGLRDVGYIEGKNIKIQHINAEHADHLHNQLSVGIRHHVDVIIATSANETAIAKQFTSTIPIIFVPAIDPVGLGFVKSRAKPHSNLTGLSFTRGTEDNSKQLAVFKQVVPALRNVVLFYDGQPTTRTPSAVLDSVKRVATHLKIQLTFYAVNSSAQAVQILYNSSHKAADGVFIICSATFRGMAPLAARAMQKKMALFGCTVTQVAEEGALMTYAPDIYYIGYRGAWYVDRILKGSKPQELPVDAPTKFDLIVNLKTARQIGITIPPEILILVDKVF